MQLELPQLYHDDMVIDLTCRIAKRVAFSVFELTIVVCFFSLVIALPIGVFLFMVWAGEVAWWLPLAAIFGAIVLVKVCIDVSKELSR